MTTFIIAVIIVIAVLLVLVVLAQDSKGGGLTGMGGATQMIGARRTMDGIEKATWVLAALMMVLSVGVNMFIDPTESGNVNVSNTIESVEAPATSLEVPTTGEETPAGESTQDAE
ncbi:preprotein translocase subunit SecG [Sediminitomix flava]|uniref:Protein-export membrane protein SecG n=1 Tax=Sediminitomix flava TaxID=379075 RepID=A0A315ZG19_SEDFL|nr:preprotein translocase subunit SecG [Sediminitomix flava]PWJ44461.1 preprotein translocase subunit SecG [Sediminitomix flava]